MRNFMERIVGVVMYPERANQPCRFDVPAGLPAPARENEWPRPPVKAIIFIINDIQEKPALNEDIA